MQKLASHSLLPIEDTLEALVVYMYLRGRKINFKKIQEPNTSRSY